MATRTTDLTQFNVDFNTINNLKSLMPMYDKMFDNFMITSPEPVPAVSFDWNGELWLRVMESGEIVGIEIENFESVFLAKHPEVAKVWKEFKPICLKNKRKLNKPDACDSFLRILLDSLISIFKTHPMQTEFLTA